MRPYFYLLKLEQNVVYRSPGISRMFGGRSKAFIDRDGKHRGFSASLMTGHSCLEGCVEKDPKAVSGLGWALPES